MKTLREMIVAFMKNGLSQVALTPSIFGTEVLTVKMSGEKEKRVLPMADLRPLAAQICTSSHGLYMTGWDTSVSFNKLHQVTGIKFRRLDRISARAHSPEREYLLASNS